MKTVIRAAIVIFVLGITVGSAVASLPVELVVGIHSVDGGTPENCRDACRGM